MPLALEKVPRHLAIIMDGNRRFARQLMLKPWMGHEWGAKKLQQVLDWCHEYGVKELTVYAFSIQNFGRPKEEFDYIMNVFRKEYAAFKEDPRIDNERIRINFLGRIQMFPQDIQQMMRDLMERTKANDGWTLNFAMAYGGREEVVDAAVRLAKEVKDGALDVDKINEQVFESHLYTASQPDLVIRTGGERRTSNFLLWQSNYSEWIFLDKTWPEFEKQDFVKCLADYADRERRFGK